MAVIQTVSKFYSCNPVLTKTLHGAAVVTFCLLSTDVRPQDEVAAFRITDIEGHVELRYQQDEDKISSGGSSASDKYTSTEEELFVLAHGYVYHPKFLNFDLGGGPLFGQTELDTAAGTVTTDSDEYNLTARLRFLEDKPYPLTLFYDKAHPSIALTATDRFEQENEKYGFNFKLRPPIWPVSLTLGAAHHETQGQGFETRIDNEIDEVKARLEVPFSKSGHAKLTFGSTDTTSRSGLIDDPIEEQKTSTDSYGLDTRNIFGERQQFQLTNILSYLERQETRPLKMLHYSPELRWSHSEDLHSFYRLNYTDTEQQTGTQTLQSTNTRVATGLSYRINKQSNTSAELHYEDNETTGLQISSYGGSAYFDYKKDFTENAVLSLSANLGYDYFDRQEANSGPVQIVDWEINFTGTDPVFLPHNHIDQTSILVSRTVGGSVDPLDASEIGSSCSGTVIVAINMIGSKTQVELCSETYLINNPFFFTYEYDPGGTATYTNLTQNYQANLRLYRHFNLYTRLGDTRAELQSGILNQELGEATNTQYGARVDYPIYESYSIGGEVTIEEEEGNLLSFDRQSTDAYFQFGFFNGVGRLATHHVTVDYLESTQDVDLVRNTLQFRVRPWNSVNLTVDLSDEEDTGGGNRRRSQIKSLQADWRVRKFMLRGETRFVTDEYAGVERERSLIKLTLRREF